MPSKPSAKALFGEDPELLLALDQLTPEQQSHVFSIILWFAKRFLLKYAKGQLEHGGNMWEKPGMLYCLIDEVVDLVAYVPTIGKQIQARDTDLYTFLVSPGESDK